MCNFWSPSTVASCELAVLHFSREVLATTVAGDDLPALLIPNLVGSYCTAFRALGRSGSIGHLLVSLSGGLTCQPRAHDGLSSCLSESRDKTGSKSNSQAGVEPVGRRLSLIRLEGSLQIVPRT